MSKITEKSYSNFKTKNLIKARNRTIKFKINK